MASRRFELGDKFWEIDRVGADLLTITGKVGTKGKTAKKSFASEDDAIMAMAKQVTSRRKKGFSQVVDAAPPSPAPAPAASNASPETSGAEDFRSRFEACIKELKANKRVHVIYADVGAPAEREALEARGAALGIQFSPAVLDFYSAMDGCALVWAPVDHPGFDKKAHRAKRGQPKLADLESLDTQIVKIIAMPPLRSLHVSHASGAPRMPFDFPGTFLTPAFRFDADGMLVQVGDDYGASWSGREASFTDYVETALATWGDIDLRRAIFINGERGVGRAHFEQDPVPLSTLLPAPPSAADKKEAKLALELNKSALGNFKTSELTAIVDMVHSTNHEHALTAIDALQQQPSRLAPHVTRIVDGLRRGPSMQRAHFEALDYRTGLIALADAIDQRSPSLSPSDRELIVRDASRDWAVRGRVAARGGAPILGVLEDMLRSSGESRAQTMRDHCAALHAVVLLGPAAVPLRELIESFHGSVAELTGGQLALGEAVPAVAGLALAAIEPARAGGFLDAILFVLESDFAHNGDYIPLLQSLPEEARRVALNTAYTCAREGRHAELPLRAALVASFGPDGVALLREWMESAPEDAKVAHDVLAVLSEAALDTAAKERLSEQAMSRYAQGRDARFAALAFLLAGRRGWGNVSEPEIAQAVNNLAQQPFSTEHTVRAAVSVSELTETEIRAISRAHADQDWPWLLEGQTP